MQFYNEWNIAFICQKRMIRVETQQEWRCVHKHHTRSIKFCPKHKKPATFAALQMSCGSLQVCAGGFRVCKTQQTYVTMSHTWVSNHAPKNSRFTSNETYKRQNLRVGVTQTSTLSTKPSIWQTKYSCSERDLMCHL